MSKQSKPLLIGAFVVGAITLLVGATLLFGGTELFAPKNRFVTYFEGSVKGLRVGANVNFRGVRIGYVTDIRLQAEVDSLKTLIPVTIEVVPSAFQLLEDDKLIDGQALAELFRLEELIKAGLRAQLNVESYVTGQLLIELDFIPDQPAVMRRLHPPYPEIPTVPNDFDKAVGNVQRMLTVIKEKVDIDAVLSNTQGILDGLNKLINSPDIKTTLAGINTLVNDPATQNLAATVGASAREIEASSKAIRTFANNADQQWNPLVGRIDKTLVEIVSTLRLSNEQISATAKRLEKTLKNSDNTLQTIANSYGEDSTFIYRVNESLVEFEGATRSLRLLLEYLEQHPEALLRGKPEQ